MLQALPWATDYSWAMPRPSEFQLIAQLFAPLAAAPGAFGLKDDAAIIAARDAMKEAKLFVQEMRIENRLRP